MKTLQSICLLTIMAVAGLVLAWPQAVFADEDEQEQIVTLEQLPAAVQATLQRESTGGTLGKIEKETKEGRVIYEADITLDGGKYEVKVTEDGILLKKELEDEDNDEDNEREGCKRQNKWSFEQDKVGSVPVGWKVAETGGTGKPATWQVVTDKSVPSPTHVVAITANKNYGRTFNLLMAKDTSYKDLEIKVMVKAVAGQEDQGGGPIWRAKDADNYYICRWNPLEDNFRVYCVKNGRRKQLGSANVRTDPAVWHKIEIEHKGSKIEAEFDGKKLIELEDSTFTEPGMVGLWVKADGRSEFDNIKVVEVGGKSKSEGKDEDEHEQKILLSDIPAKVLKAANNALAGGKVIEAEKKIDDDTVVYEVKKIVNNVKYEIEVTSNGTVKKVEKDNNDENGDSGND